MINVRMADRLRDGVRLLLRPSGSPPRPSWRSLAFDAMVALGLSLGAIQAGPGSHYPQTFFEPGSAYPIPSETPGAQPLSTEYDQVGWVILMLLVAAPLVARRRFPLAMLSIVMVSATFVTDDHAALRLSFYACVIAGYSAVVYSPYRVPALASLPVAALLYSRVQEEAWPTVSNDTVPFLILIPIAVLADGLRRWKRHADEGRARMSALEHEQAEALRRATEHERARIARELHDVVTHNVSVMVIQAGAARKVMDASPDQAREALLAVEAGGRAAMTELRHVMGLLTIDSDGPDPAGAAELTPLPGLDRLEALVTRVRDAGVPIELSIAGQPRPVSSGVELTAYRAVQEALTNTVKHTVGASATVVVEYGADHLRVQITNTGGVPHPPAATGNGRGLMGLRERLAVYGGTLQAGPRLSGGYRVTAQIPLEAS